MKRIVLTIVLALGLVVPVTAQETPEAVANAYDALADTILAVRKAELNLVASILDGHRHAAKVRAKNGDWEGAAGEIALFANEGDNKVGGVRKRLLEGGHHFNADDGTEGEFEEGYVIVTRKAKAKILEASTALRKAETDEDRKKILGHFFEISEKLLTMD